MQLYKFVSYDADGKELSVDELFNAWIQMAHTLSVKLPQGPRQDLCAAVYEAVTAEDSLTPVEKKS